MKKNVVAKNNPTNKSGSSGFDVKKVFGNLFKKSNAIFGNFLKIIPVVVLGAVVIKTGMWGKLCSSIPSFSSGSAKNIELDMHSLNHLDSINLSRGSWFDRHGKSSF